MKANSPQSARPLWLSLAFLSCSAAPLRAEQFGLFTYQQVGGVDGIPVTITITDYPTSAAGHVEIPAEINGVPVTRISGSAFSSCSLLTSVTIPTSITWIGGHAFYRCSGVTTLTIPSGVTDIGGEAFSNCTGLTSVNLPSSLNDIGEEAFYRCSGLEAINVEPGNPSYASVGGVLFNGTETTLILFPEGKTGVYTIPSTVTSIGAFAFLNCIGLSSITIPSSVSWIDNGAFFGCTGLTSITIHSGSNASISNNSFAGCTSLMKAVFFGDAPFVNYRTFADAPLSFRIYYLSGRAGYATPTWQGYSTVMIDEATYPAASWLLKHGYWYNTGLHLDPDRDGVNLLMAYALDLDPRLNLKGSLPMPVLGADTLSLSFHATSPGIIYRVETSTDLQNWTTTGVTQTAPGPDQRSTAIVSRDAPNRYLRLKVEQ